MTATPEQIANVEADLEFAEVLVQQLRAMRSDVILTESGDRDKIDALERAVDECVCEVVTRWELIGRPDELRSRLETLPDFDRWRIEVQVDPDTNAAFDALPKEIDHPRITKGGTFVYDVPDKAPAVWGTGDQVLWAQGEALLIAGPTGTGKSTLCAQLVAGRLGILDNVLGHPVTADRRPVLYLAMDRPTQIRRLLNRLFRHYDARDVLDERLIVWSGPLPATLNTEPTVIVELALQLDVGTVVVDSLKDAAVKLTDDESGGNINRAFQEVTAEGIDLVVLHHQRKGSADQSKAPKTIDDMYGSSMITNGMGSVLALHGAPGDAIVDLRHLKQPLEEMPPTRIEHDNQTGLSHVVAGFDPLQFLSRRPRGATAKEAAVAMYEKQNPSAAEIAKAKRSLDSLQRRMPDQVHRSTPSGRGGEGGQAPARWTFIGDEVEALGAATGAATQGVTA